MMAAGIKLLSHVLAALHRMQEKHISLGSPVNQKK